VFYGNLATLYYLSGTTNWGPLFDGHPAVLWNPSVPFNYTTINDTITITEYTGSSGMVSIPSSIDFLPVTSIGDWTFGHNESLTNVTIPSGVVSIGDDAFADTSLTSVIIPSSVTDIGNESFGWCSLTSITVPDSVTNMGYMVFYETGVTNAVIGNGVTAISDSAFEYCTSLATVTIGKNVNTIGEGAFSACEKLNNVVIPEGVTCIEDDAFINCYALTSIIIPNSVTNLGNWAFAYCNKMTNAVIGNQVTSINGGAFSGTSLSDLTIPSSVTNIEGQAFQYCGLIEAYCKGNAPTVSPTAFDGTDSVVFYYLPGATGWSSSFDGFASILWNPQMQTTNGNFGVQNNQFGFNITGTTNIPIVVEGCTNLANATWTTLQSCLVTNGNIYFSDPHYSEFPSRLYRIRSP
jgi:hypothetical protein